MIKSGWKIILAIAVIATLGFVGFDFFFALEGDGSLVKYEVDQIDNKMGEDVLEHVAVFSKRYIFDRSDDILEEN